MQNPSAFRRSVATNRQVELSLPSTAKITIWVASAPRRARPNTRGSWRSFCPEASGPAPSLLISPSTSWPLEYLKFADGYYLKNGKPTKEPENIGFAIRPLSQLYGHTLAAEFGPIRLKAVRQAMIDANLCRNEINKRIGKLVRMFKWAASEELIPGSVFHALQAVTGLRRGRSGVRESPPVKPVPIEFVEAIRPHVSRQVWAMIQLQLLTGARSWRDLP